jgi:hypothetical protein
MELILNDGDIDPAIEVMFGRLLNEVDEFQHMRSGYKWDGSIRLEIFVSKWQKGISRSKKAGCYIRSPAWVSKKRAVCNMKTNDDKCFAWVLLRARYPLPKNVGGKQRNSVEPELRAHLHEVILPEGIHYPIPLHEKVCGCVFFARECHLLIFCDFFRFCVTLSLLMSGARLRFTVWAKKKVPSNHFI